MKRAATAAERHHMQRVSEMPCVVCLEALGQWNPQVQVHHCRTRHGWGRSSHFDTIPVCATHHNDHKIGIHGLGREEFATMYGYSEAELLAITKKQLGVA